MIVKGHDFPNVTLVGILLADTTLHMSDYMAAERTFELLTQAAGRAGRRDKRGDVIIQTYDPEHYSIRCSANQDYDAFYEAEIAYRDLMNYPPVMHMLNIRIASEDEECGTKAAELIKKITVYVSVSKYGEIQVGEDGIKMAYAPVLLSGKEEYTVDDALRAMLQCVASAHCFAWSVQGDAPD